VAQDTISHPGRPLVLHRRVIGPDDPAYDNQLDAAHDAKPRPIIRNLGKLGVPADDVFIVLHEPSMENWGIRGGRSADEVDLGF
jgi:hypothetical protein